MKKWLSSASQRAAVMLLGAAHQWGLHSAHQWGLNWLEKTKIMREMISSILWVFSLWPIVEIESNGSGSPSCKRPATRAGGEISRRAGDEPSKNGDWTVDLRGFPQNFRTNPHLSLCVLPRLSKAKFGKYQDNDLWLRRKQIWRHKNTKIKNK